MGMRTTSKPAVGGTVPSANANEHVDCVSPVHASPFSPHATPLGHTPDEQERASRDPATACYAEFLAFVETLGLALLGAAILYMDLPHA
jgi:hypothetical protein